MMVPDQTSEALPDVPLLGVGRSSWQQRHLRSAPSGRSVLRPEHDASLLHESLHQCGSSESGPAKAAELHPEAAVGSVTACAGEEISWLD
eukprot:Skav225175  [mRNA]  locus=scaffold1095:314442:316945:- [translate_table: standard]